MAMVATTPQEKLLTGRRAVRNWTQLCCQSVIQMVTPYDIKLAYVQIITFVLRRINKNCCHQSCTFHSKSFRPNRLSAAASPRPYWRNLQRSPRPLAVFRGPTSKGIGRGDDRRGKEERGGKGKDGVRPSP